MKNQYIPDRNDIAWIDFEPAKGKEIGKYRPALILSSKQYNHENNLVICCAISTSIRNKLSEVPVKNLDQPSVVTASMIHTISWKARNTKFIAHAEDGIMTAVLQRLIPLIGADKILLESAGLSR
ncbi:MAG: type II toxin-antitoxin system PemK/MazF family toxin [Gammaproteobacteria bacterium]|nr:type II toxin-antitoxin system PemK/MazF family toxin [Gammaproteobacteria bacterium]